MKTSTTINSIACLVLLGLSPGCLPAGHAGPSPPADGQSGAGSSPSAGPSARPAVDRPPAAAPATGAADPGSQWSVGIEPDSTLLIRHKGVSVVRATYCGFGENWKWANPAFKASSIREGRSVVSGAMSVLDIRANGSTTPVADNELRVDYQLRIGKPHPKIIGGGLEWKLDLESASFEGKVPDPVLLADNKGWTWPVGGNQSITVRFNRPIAKVYFERNNKHFIRTFFFADHLEAGEIPISYTVQIPMGGRIAPSPEDRYGPVDTAHWFRDALRWDQSPVDLLFLNANERPAGRHGFLKARGDGLVFDDGTSVRFWGANLVANAIFETPRQNIARQAHRMSQLGYNLMRIHHHDSWINVFDRKHNDTRHLDPERMDILDWWVKCLEDEGIYIWLDMHVGRALRPGDDVSQGRAEIERGKGMFAGFNYYNPDIENLMKEFQHNYLNHVNKYTKLKYKDDPAVVGVLITNENDLSYHFGNIMLPGHNNPVHNALFTAGYKSFARKHGLVASRVFQTWLPGPSKLYLDDVEHQFNRTMIDDLRAQGVRVPIATTQVWGNSALFVLPSLTDGDIIDVHSYGASEAMDANPRYAPNFLTWIGMAQVEGKPLAITEWDVEFPAIDRFTAPLYLAGVASLQGWDMPMLFDYSDLPLQESGKKAWEVYQWAIHKFTTFNDPAICGVMPAAAVAFRQNHIRPARDHYCLSLTPTQLIDQLIDPKTSATLRTLLEQSRLTIGLPAVKELPWLKPTELSAGTIVVTDPHHDFIPAGQSFVRSDTGELTRNWKYGIQTINTPKTQAVSGWVGGKALKLGDATFRIDNRKAVVALTSIDDQPLSSSRLIMITAIARVVPSASDRLPYFSEPVVGTVTLRTKTANLQLQTLASNGTVQERLKPQNGPDGLIIRLPAGRGTHWFVLKAPAPNRGSSKPEPHP